MHHAVASVSLPALMLLQVCEEARTSLTQALVRGKTGLTVETSMGALDVTSRAYQPDVFARFALPSPATHAI